MNLASRMDGILSPSAAFIILVLGGVLLFAAIATELLYRLKYLGEERRSELVARNKSWVVLLAAMITPIVCGRVWTILAVCLMSLVCFREYSRATGLFRERMVSALVVLGVLLVNLAAMDHWYGFFTALASLAVMVIAAIPILQDRPEGYVQRSALAVFGFMFFGYSFGHLSYIANDGNFQAIILLLFITVEGNDVAAYIFGNLFGKRKLSPNTSPGKTIAGALGAVFTTTVVMMLLGRLVFAGTAMATLPMLALLGVVVSISGQLGDLMLSSIKRDVGVKDLGQLLPGHGGMLDRFDSLTLACPAFFHFVGYVNGFGLDQPVRIFSGS